MRRLLSWVVPSLLGIGIAGLDTGAAASQALTSNFNNSVVAVVVAPPTDVAATSTLKLLALPPSCQVRVTWTAPVMANIGGYEVRRVLTGTNTEIAPPVYTANRYYDDNRSPLTLLGDAYDYQVRTILGATSWRSQWATANAGITVLCLVPLGAAAGPDSFAPVGDESDEPPPEPGDVIEPTEEPTQGNTVPSTSTLPPTSVPVEDQPAGAPPSTTVPPAVTVAPSTTVLLTAPATTAPVATLLHTSMAVVTGS